MSWTYDAAQLANNEMFQVRYAIGDVDSTAPLLSDEEIDFALTDASVHSAAIACCKAIIARYSKKPDYSMGPYSVKNTDVVNNYAKILRRLENEHSFMHTPFVTNSDRPVFDIDMMNASEDYHGTGN